MKNKPLWRKLINDVHLWLGIGSGLVLFVVCLSGTIYTFHSEIEEFVEPEKFSITVPAQAVALAPDALIAKLEQEQKGKVTALEIPQDPAKPYRVTMSGAGGQRREGGRGEAREGRDKPEERAGAATPGKTDKHGEGEAVAGKRNGEVAQAGGAPGAPKAEGQHSGGRPGGRGTTYLVNPYTGAVQGTPETSATEFFRTMMKLHRWLLVEAEPGAVNPGKIIVGVSTIIFTFLLLSGLVLWFPVKLKNWKQGLKIKTSANWKRVNHDLHNTLGFYSFLLLLIMALTGLCWSFDWYRDGMSAVLGEEVFKGRREQPLPSDPATATGAKPTVAAYIQKANSLLPYEGNIRISLPTDSTGSVVVNKSKAGFFALSAADKVQLNQYNNEPLKVEIFSKKPLNVQIASSIKPLHLGEIYGTFSKILYFIACLVATSLPVTGTMIWINKLRKKPKKGRSLKNKSMAA